MSDHVVALGHRLVINDSNYECDREEDHRAVERVVSAKSLGREVSRDRSYPESLQV